MPPKVLQGTPGQIIKEAATEITEALQRAGIPPNSVEAMALLYVSAGMFGVCKDEPTMNTGRPLSFINALRLFTHVFAETKWTPEELKEFDAEFQLIVESLGGHKMAKDGSSKPSPIIMSPNLGSC